MKLAPADAERNAVIGPARDGRRPLWHLIAEGGERRQNAIGAEIVRRCNAPPPWRPTQAEAEEFVREVAHSAGPCDLGSTHAIVMMARALVDKLGGDHE